MELADRNWPVLLFNKSVLKQRKYREITHLLGEPDHLHCLDVGSDNGVISYLLREKGGTWKSADLDEKSVNSIRQLVNLDVFQIDSFQKYETKSRHLQIEQRIHFLGPKPVGHLAEYLSQADILVSPRIKGDNTPMKIYSYLDSGKALLATSLATHTQVLDSRVAALADPFPDAFSKAMLRLIEDETLRMDLGIAGKKMIEEKHTYTAFREKLLSLFDWLETELNQGHTVASSVAERSPRSLQ